MNAEMGLRAVRAMMEIVRNSREDKRAEKSKEKDEEKKKSVRENCPNNVEMPPSLGIITCVVVATSSHILLSPRVP